MVSRLKNITKSSMTLEIGFYTITTILNNALPFLLLPILTRYLNPEEYGYLTLFNVYTALGTILVGGASAAQLKNMFYKQSQADSAKLNFNIVTLQVGLTLFICLLMSIFSQSLEQLLDLPLLWLLLLPVLSFSMSIGNLGMVLLRCQRYPIIYGVAQIITTVINLSLSLVFIIFLHLGWEGRALAIVIASFIYGSASVTYLVRSGYLQINLNPYIIKKLAYLTGSLLPAALFVQIIGQSGKLFVNTSQSTAELGLYNIGFLVGMVVFFLALSSLNAIEPWTYRQLAEGSSAALKSIEKVLCGYFLAALTCALLVSFCSELIVSIMAGEDYRAAHIFVPWIAFGYAGWAGYASLFPIIISNRKQNVVLLISATGAVLCLSLNYVLIDNRGTVGAAQAFFFTYLFMFLCCATYTMKVLRPKTRKSEEKPQNLID